MKAREMSESPRFLNRDIKSKMLAPPKEGGAVLEGFPLLTTGTWTDSAVQTPLHYPPATLEKDADNWEDNGLWTRHPGATPRSVNDKIGEIRNRRFDPNFEGGAILGDLYFYNDTQNSRDALTQVLEGRINAISVEHRWEEKYNAKSKEYDATSLTFLGAALVDKGACKKCVRKNEDVPEPGSKEVKNMAKDTQERDLEAEVTELTKKLSEAPKAEDVKALSEKVKALEDEKAKHEKELADTIAKYEERVRKLEKSPQDPKSLGDDGSNEPVKDLEAPGFRVIRAGRDVEAVF